MKKRLLICLAFFATAGIMNAQTWVKATSNEREEVLQQKDSPFKPMKVQKAEKVSATTKIKLNDNQFALGYCAEEPDNSLGTGAPASLGGAIFFPAELLSKYAGNKIKMIRFGINTTLATDVSVWITKRLGGTMLYEQEVVTVEEGWNDITLEMPYDIDASGIYVGYSYNITSANSDKTRYPIHVSGFGSNVQNATWLFINGQWMDGYGYSYGCLQIQAIVEGDNLPVGDVSFENITYNRSIANQSFSVGGMIGNYGIKEVNSVEVSYTINGVTKQAVGRLEEPLASNASGVFYFDAEAPEAGMYDMEVVIDKVNGSNDPDMSDNKLSTGLISMTESFPRNTVVEEFTGTWCPYCTRGIAGMKMMTNKYPDSFIGIAVHWSQNASTKDKMQTDDYADLMDVVEPGFPYCVVDRNYGGDPLFDIEGYYQLSQMQKCEASLALQTSYTNDTKTEVAVNSKVQFSYPDQSTRYRMAYVVVEDNVTGYTQSNAYSGASLTPEDIANLPPEFIEIVNMPQSITNMAFMDVARGIYNCMGIEGSLEGAIKLNEPKTHTYTITLPLTIKNKDNVRIIAMLIYEPTGEIINAVQAKIGDSAVTGNQYIKDSGFSVTIEASNALLTVTATENGVADLYSADGTKVATAAVNGSAAIPVAGLKGTYIVRVNNGKDVVVKKIIL